MRKLALVALLLLAGCGPRPELQAEICQILALPGAPGVDILGDGNALMPLDTRMQSSASIYAPGLRMDGLTKSWGRCAKIAPTVEMLLLEGDNAMTKGGLRTDGRQTTYGTCYYVRTDGAWRLRACRINGRS